MAQSPGPLRRAWYEWKMLRFPWRKRWLVGFDLQGNTFWEFKDALNALRHRRIAKYARSTHYSEVNVSPAWMQWLRHTREHPPTILEQQQDLHRQATIKLLAARADQRWAEKPSALDAPDKQQPIQVLESRDPRAGVGQMNRAAGGLEERVRELREAEMKGQTGQVGHVERASVEEKKVPIQVESPKVVPTPAPKQTTPETRQTSSTPTPAAPATTTTFKPKKKKASRSKDAPWNMPAHVNPGEDWQPKGWAPAPAKRRR